jgi:hypothetical protein
MAKSNRTTRTADEIERRIAEIVGSQESEGTRQDLAELIEYRRGPQGRMVIVARGAPNDVRALGTGDVIYARGIYDLKRPAKRKRYLKLKGDGNYKGPRVLAEGDSWFEHPCPKDLIEWTGETYAVLSLAKAGDSWGDYFQQEGLYYDDRTPTGLYENMRLEKPQIVVMSGSGNEVLGSIETYVRRFNPDLPPEQHIIMERFEEVLEYCETWCGKYARGVIAAGAQFVHHGYDYPDPRSRSDGGQLLGGPLEDHCGIPGPYYWRAIVNKMIDLYNERIAKLLRSIRGAHFLDLRGTIGNRNAYQGPNKWYWWDEVHPSPDGSKLVAAKFKDEIKRISGF